MVSQDTQSMIVKRMLMESRPLVENYQQMLSFCLLNLRVCHWHLHICQDQQSGAMSILQHETESQHASPPAGFAHGV